MSSTHDSRSSRRGRLAADAGRALGHWTSLLFALAAAGFVVLLSVDRPLFDVLVDQDHIVENATSLSLFAAAGLFALAARVPGSDRHRRVFCATLAVLLFFAGMDEISWGQRILGLETPEFFKNNADHSQITIHNTFQRWSGLLTKHIVGLTFAAYGVVVPWLLHAGTIAHRGILRHVVWPPVFLSPAFMFGALFMIDLPTGNEEEVGELLLSVCLLIFGGYLVSNRASRTTCQNA